MMKRLSILFIVILSHSFAQNKDTIWMPEITISSPGLVFVKTGQQYGEDIYAAIIDTSRRVIKYVDSSSCSPSVKSYIQYFMARLNYPDEAIEMGVSGKVYACFNIGQDGKPTHIILPRKVYSILNNMVLKILEECIPFDPKWCSRTTLFIQAVKFDLMD